MLVIEYLSVCLHGSPFISDRIEVFSDALSLSLHLIAPGLRVLSKPVALVYFLRELGDLCLLLDAFVIELVALSGHVLELGFLDFQVLILQLYQLLKIAFLFTPVGLR